MRNKVHNYLYVALMLALLMAGCKSSQKVATIDADGAKTPVEFLDAMKAKAFTYQTVSARIQADVKLAKSEISSRVDLKIVRDSALQLSVQPFLGVEMFRIEMNKDSILVIDRLNKQYVFDSFDQLKGQTPITFNFYNLQAMFVNHLFFPGEREVDKRLYNRYLMKQEGPRIEARVKDVTGLTYTFIADGEEKLLSTAITDASNRYALLWSYTDFRLNDSQPFPMLMDTKLMADGALAGGLKMAFNRLQTDVPVKIDLMSPDKYKRITFAQMLKSMGINK